MKGFILITNQRSEQKCCIAINAITAIDERWNGTAYIKTREVASSNLKHRDSFGVYTEESFDEVIKLLENSI